jgi:hypothetical protein
MAYNVYLFNGLPISAAMNRTTLSGDQLIAINRTLQDYFDRVVRAHDNLNLPGRAKYGRAQVQWLAGFATVAPNELLIYLLPAGATLVRAGKLQQGQPPAGHDGLTNPNLQGETGSEVYFHFADTTLLANLMFHEAMHNKLALGNAQLHPRGGLASATVEPATPLTPGNISNMAASLDVNRPQWTAGMRMLAAAWMIPDSDPMKGMF